jgi:hypothetical protein
VKAQISIFDINGRLVWEKKDLSGEQKMSGNVSEFTRGAYFVKVIDSGNEIYNHKIVLE